MSRQREVHLRGKYITFDRANSFQLSANPPRSRKSHNLASTSKDPASGVASQQLYPSETYPDSETSSSPWSESEESDQRPLGEIVEKQIGNKYSKKRPQSTPYPTKKKVKSSVPQDMQRSVSLGISPRDHGYSHESQVKKRLGVNASGRSIKSFINAAIDPHIMKVMSDGTIMVSDATLAGAEFGLIANSLTGSKEFVIGEAQVLAILLKHATQRIKRLVAPSKRKRRYQGQKNVTKNIVGATGIKTIAPNDGMINERPIGTTALMGYAAQPIQKKPLSVETTLVAPSVGCVSKSSAKWYHL